MNDLRKLVADELSDVVKLREELAEHDLDATAWLDAIEGETDFQEAIGEVASAIFEIDGQVAGVKSMEEVLRRRKSRLERTKDSLRGVILMAMENAGVHSVKRPHVTVSTKNKPREIAEIDEALVPSSFFVPQPPKLDRKALKQALADGEEVEGARLDNGGLSLTMRFV